MQLYTIRLPDIGESVSYIAALDAFTELQALKFERFRSQVLGKLQSHQGQIGAFCSQFWVDS